MNKNFYKDLSYAKIENRMKRQGFPEGIYCPGKAYSQILQIVKIQIKNKETLILTRADKKLFLFLKKRINKLKYNDKAQIIYLSSKFNKIGLIAIVTAGTSDIPVAEEAATVSEILGNKVDRYYDIGVAGVHRLFSNLENIKKAKVVIAIAGMDGVLPSLIGGLVNVPVIAIPTSVGYGVNLGGISALFTMLNSCASNVSVVNINNGFSAGIIASLINKQSK